MSFGEGDLHERVKELEERIRELEDDNGLLREELAHACNGNPCVDAMVSAVEDANGMQKLVWTQEREIAELEERVRELARENAELKQVPRHSDGSPRCPLRDSMTGEMGACDLRCAWLVDVCQDGKKPLRVCSAVLTGMDGPRKPLNAMEVGS